MLCKKRFFIVLASVLFASSCTTPNMRYINDPQNMLQLRNQKMLVLPVDSLHVKYIDNTKVVPDTLFPNSFFVKAAQDFMGYEGKKSFQLCEGTTQESDSLACLYVHGVSYMERDTGALQKISQCVRTLAEKYKADLVLVPYKFELKNNVIRAMGWREDKYAGPAYERPVSHSATTRCHVQIWSKSGIVLYERIAVNTTTRPILYSLLNREKKPDKDLVKYAHRIYAPPLVKSLYLAIKSAMSVRF